MKLPGGIHHDIMRTSIHLITGLMAGSWIEATHYQIVTSRKEII